MPPLYLASAFLYTIPYSSEKRECNPSSLGLDREDPDGTAILDTP